MVVHVSNPLLSILLNMHKNAKPEDKPKIEKLICDLREHSK